MANADEAHVYLPIILCFVYLAIMPFVDRWLINRRERKEKEKAGLADQDGPNSAQ